MTKVVDAALGSDGALRVQAAVRVPKLRLGQAELGAPARARSLESDMPFRHIGSPESYSPESMLDAAFSIAA